MPNLLFKTPDVQAGYDKLVPGLQKALQGLTLPATVTSTLRTPAENKAVGGVPNSYHMTGHAVDLRTRDKTPDEIAAYTKYFSDQGYKVINEGDHLHIQPGSGGAVDHNHAPSPVKRQMLAASSMPQRSMAPSGGMLQGGDVAAVPEGTSQPPIEPRRPRRKRTFLGSLGDFMGAQIPLFGALKVLFEKKGDDNANA